MILLDPDLEPDPAPTDSSTKRKSAGISSPKTGAAKPNRDGRTPSPRTLARFLAVAQKAVRLKGQVNVLLTTDPAIRRLNRQFRGKNKATDVLSFPADGIGAEEIAGDLAISVPTARRQAVGQGHALATEIKVLMLHGLLHLAGYDHEADTGQMARRERLLRARLGLPQGLIERVEGKREIPRGLKPRNNVRSSSGTAEALPSQSPEKAAGNGARPAGSRTRVKPRPAPRSRRP